MWGLLFRLGGEGDSVMVILFVHVRKSWRCWGGGLCVSDCVVVRVGLRIPCMGSGRLGAGPGALRTGPDMLVGSIVLWYCGVGAGGCSRASAWWVILLYSVQMRWAAGIVAAVISVMILIMSGGASEKFAVQLSISLREKRPAHLRPSWSGMVEVK